MMEENKDREKIVCEKLFNISLLSSQYLINYSIPIRRNSNSSSCKDKIVKKKKFIFRKYILRNIYICIYIHDSSTIPRIEEFFSPKLPRNAYENIYRLTLITREIRFSSRLTSAKGMADVRSLCQQHYPAPIYQANYRDTLLESEISLRETIWWWPSIIRRYSGIYSRMTVEQIPNFEGSGAKRGIFFFSSLLFRANLSGLGSGPVWISRHVPKSFNDAKLSLRGTARVRRRERPSRESEDSIK